MGEAGCHWVTGNGGEPALAHDWVWPGGPWLRHAGPLGEALYEDWVRRCRLCGRTQVFMVPVNDEGGET